MSRLMLTLVFVGLFSSSVFAETHRHRVTANQEQKKLAMTYLKAWEQKYIESVACDARGHKVKSYWGKKYSVSKDEPLTIHVFCENAAGKRDGFSKEVTIEFWSDGLSTISWWCHEWSKGHSTGNSMGGAQSITMKEMEDRPSHQ